MIFVGCGLGGLCPNPSKIVKLVLRSDLIYPSGYSNTNLAMLTLIKFYPLRKEFSSVD
ncbi:hypothetical protein ACV3WJ_16430 [Clostridium perfringens]